MYYWIDEPAHRLDYNNFKWCNADVAENCDYIFFNFIRPR